MPMAITSTTIPMRRAKKRDWSWLAGYALIALPVLIMVALIFYPAVLALIDTLFVPDATTGVTALSLSNYQAFFKDRILVANLLFTFQVTLTAVALLFVIGYPLALYLRFSKSWVTSMFRVWRSTSMKRSLRPYCCSG